MMKKFSHRFMIFLFFQLFLSFSTANAKQYYLSICAMFNDEAPYLKEWIEYHRMVGVEHFWLYNNNSTDDYLKVLKPYISKGIVELIDWPGADGVNYLPIQRKAYNHCIENCGKKTSWLAVIDIDEFVIPVKKPNLVAFLAEFDKQPHIGGITINWQVYGTSGLATLPKDKLMVESLTYKAPTMFEEGRPNHQVIKSIVRPEAVHTMDVHLAIYKKGFRTFPGKSIGVHQPIEVDKIRINHYWTRAEDFLYNVKIGRRIRCMTPDEIEVVLNSIPNFNLVEDRIMDRFIPKLKQRMKKPV